MEMDKKKRVKKNFDGNANQNEEEKPSSSSSSCYWTRSRKEPEKYPEDGDLSLTRKRKKDTNDSPPSQQSQEEAADEVVTEGPINDLPPEMLTKILKYIETLELFDCRLVNLHWLEISSGILTTRPDLVLKFKDYDIKIIPGQPGPPEKKKNTKLQEFVQSIIKCSHFPFARFSFHFEEPSFLDDKDWIEFLSLFAPSKNPQPNPDPNQRTKIKYLQFKWYSINKTKAMLLFTEKLMDLLNKIPHLEQLGLDFSTDNDDFKNFKLFPLPKHTESESKRTAKIAVSSSSASASVQLPCLKVLEIEADMFVHFPGIVKDLLDAAVNLTRIQVEWPCWIEGVCTSQVFQFLHSLGKIHLLKNVKIHVDEDFLSSLRNSTLHSKSNSSLGFKVRELKLNAFAKNINPSFYADATNFISNLLESSRETLEKLELPPLGFLGGLQFPKFTKLRTLELVACDDDDDDDDNLNHVERGQQFFPLETRAKEIFPAVDHLNVTTADWERAFPQEDSIPIFPNVQAFWFNDYELAENVIAKLALLCPNLKHCTIQKSWRGNPEGFNFPQIGREIWTHLDQLKSLEVDLDINLENHAFPALDSCFTGISPENCQRLQDLMEAEKTRKKSKSQVKLPESEELKTLTKREHPSILDMKNLKKLTIKAHSGKKRHEGKRFFTTKITWISEEFAFKLMPNLQFNGRRPSASS